MNASTAITDTLLRLAGSPLSQSTYSARVRLLPSRLHALLLATCLRDFVTNRHESPGLLPDLIPRHLQALLKKYISPIGQSHDPQGQIFVLQMPIPGKRHEDVGDGEQQDCMYELPLSITTLPWSHIGMTCRRT